MNKKDFGEIKSILGNIATRLETLEAVVKSVQQNQKVMNAKVEAWDEDFKTIRKAVTNVELVSQETARQVTQIRDSTTDTVSKQGQRIKKLELVRDTPSGGRRPARKNS